MILYYQCLIISTEKYLLPTSCFLIAPKKVFHHITERAISPTRRSQQSVPPGNAAPKQPRLVLSCQPRRFVLCWFHPHTESRWIHVLRHCLAGHRKNVSRRHRQCDQRLAAKGRRGVRSHFFVLPGWKRSRPSVMNSLPILTVEVAITPGFTLNLS